jgi:2-haloacid dehalogenase
MPPTRPTVVAFDVVETLLSLAPVDEALAPTGISLDLYFARLLRDGFALVAAGDFRPFTEVAHSALRAAAPAAPPQVIDEVVGAFSRLPAHPDVRPAFDALVSAGVTIATLTNGSANTTSALLARAGLDSNVRHIFSVDDVSAWKPSPRPYRHATAMLGIDPAAMALVTVHPWDIHGASRARLTTGWCSRLAGQYPEVFDPPDVSAADLVTVVEELLRLPAADELDRPPG